jgi:hypothetical protein
MAQRWQYITQVFEGRTMQDELDDLGEAGWELITAHWEEYSYGGRTQMQARCILKRPRDNEAEIELSDEFWQEPATAGRS